MNPAGTLNTPQFAELLASAVTEPGRISAAFTAFHGYSLGNQLLAMWQCAQRGLPLGPIASFNGWKDKGRHVIKGQKALALCMPVTCKVRGDTADDDATFSSHEGSDIRQQSLWAVRESTEAGAKALGRILPIFLDTRTTLLDGSSEVWCHPERVEGFGDRRDLQVRSITILAWHVPRAGSSNRSPVYPREVSESHGPLTVTKFVTLSTR